jgi:tryptophan 7-halogenase
MLGNRLRSIAVLGDGTATWMAAAAFARALGKHCVIRVIAPGGEPRGLTMLAAGEGTLPAIRAFHQLVGIDENDLVYRTASGFKLGTRFCDWSALGRSYFHPFGDFGATLDSVAFQHHWIRLRTQGHDVPFGAYSLASAAAEAGRFTRPLDDPRSVMSTFSYGLHLDSARYTSYLRDIAEGYGVIVVAGVVIDIEKRDEEIAAVHLAGGERIEADLFVDCSGVLVEGILRIGYEDWSSWLPCDRALAAVSAPSGDALPFTEARATGAGWRWRIPLRDRTGHGLIYSSRHLSENDACGEFTDGLDAKTLGEVKSLHFINGRRRQFWSGNIVALGDAAGFLEPLEATNLHLVHSGIARLLSLLPDRDRAGAERTEYNRRTIEEWERVRDFLILHYKATNRDDTPFWKSCHTMEVPETLAYKIKLFEARGRVVLYDEETFAEPDFLSVFIGQDVLPRCYDPVADTIEFEVTRSRLDRMHLTIRQAAKTMPSYASFLARYRSSLPSCP